MRRRRPAAALTGRASAGWAIGAGALLGAAFLAPSLGFLAWFAFVPLLDVLEARHRAHARGRSMFGAGWRFGFAFYLIGIHWIARLSDVAITVPWLKYPAWVAAAAYLALFPGLAAWLAGWLSRQSGRSLAVTFPVSFVVVEELRASGELGFPWFQPGYSQAAFTPFLQLASLGGVTLVTLWLLVSNVLLWRSLTARDRLRTAFGWLLAMLLPWMWGQRALEAAPHGTGPSVALVQGNVSGEMKWSGQHQKEILERFLNLSIAAVSDSARPRLVIWPETATGSWLRKQPEYALPIAALASSSGATVFSGFPDYDLAPDGRPLNYNAAGAFTPDGAPGARYAKRHLVPFGERMPFQGLLPFLGKLDLGQAEWTPGREAVLFPSEAGPFGCLICFESIFPDLAREDVRRGARWIVNITNDEWFGRSPALTQHAAMAQFRAVENHVPLARCANTGITELVDANGRVRLRLPEFKEGALVGSLGVPGPPTPFTRAGDWPGLLCGAAFVLLTLASLAPASAWRR